MGLTFVDGVLIALAAAILNVILLNLIFHHAKKQAAADGHGHEKVHYQPLQAGSVAVLSPAAIAELEAAARNNYKVLLEQTNSYFKSDMEKTSRRLGEQVTNLTTIVIEKELDNFHKVLSDVNKSATTTLSQIQEVLEKRRGELEQQMQSEIADEKARLLKKFDERLADIVSSYLVESLGQGVDLGAQTAYIIRNLEEHKEELKAELQQ